MDTNIDICLTNDTKDKLCAYSNDVENDGTINVNSVVKALVENSTIFVMNESTHIDHSYTSIKEVKLGDIVIVHYTPYSQKYLDHYNEQDVRGKIVYIDIENDDLIVYRDEKTGYNTYTRIVKSLNRDYCSYFGDTRGYDYFIQKVNV